MAERLWKNDRWMRLEALLKIIKNIINLLMF